MPSPVIAVPLALLLAVGTTATSVAPAPQPAAPQPAAPQPAAPQPAAPQPAAPQPAAPQPAAPQPAPTSDQAAVDNGWGAEPAPTTATAPTPAPVVPITQTPAIDPAEEERLWRLKQHSRFKGIMIAGFATLGAVYGVSVLIGAVSIDVGRDDADPRQGQYGRRMMIPLGGPFAAAPVSGSATLAVLTVSAGLGQLLGLAMGIAGAVKLKEFPNPNKRKFAFGVAPTRNGAQAGLSLRF